MLQASTRQLRAFVAVARHLSFARAAQDLCVTPPAVTQQIKELEAMVGLPLFDRLGRRVSLTVTGEYCLVYAKRVLATLKEADDMVARFRKLEAGRITVGAVNTAKYFLPHLLVQFNRSHPHVEVQLAIDTRSRLLQQLADNEIDVAVMGRPPREMALRAEPFARNTLGFIAPADHALAQLDAVEPVQLLAMPMVARERDSGTRGVFDRWCAEHRLTPHIALEAWSNEVIKQAVLAGMGLGFLSLHTVGTEFEFGLLRLVRVAGTPIPRRWHCVHAQAKPLSPVAEAFRYFLLEQGEQVLAARYRSLGPWLNPGV